jgi:hypothetical protein
VAERGRAHDGKIAGGRFERGASRARDSDNGAALGIQ